MGRRAPRSGALNPVKRTVTTVVLLAAIACLVLLAFLDRIQGFQTTRPAGAPPSPTGAPEPASAAEPDAAPAESAGDELRPGELSGVVRFADGSPAPGASVTVTLRGAEGALPDEVVLAAGPDGRFAHDVGDRQIVAVSASLGPLADRVVNEPSRTAGRLGLRFAETFELRGIVQRSDDRRGVAGALVQCGGHETRTEQDGSFALVVASTVVSDPRSAIRVSAAGHETVVDVTPWGRPPSHYGDLTYRLTPR